MCVCVQYDKLSLFALCNMYVYVYLSTYTRILSLNLLVITTAWYVVLTLTTMATGQ